jgi:glycosyltransferase involved in cell wall biosynthesis
MFTGMVSGFIYAATSKWMFRQVPGVEYHLSPWLSKAPISTHETDVLLLSYQQAPFLKEALDSVLHQTYQNFRIIAVDDGSTDGSLEILKSYESQYPDQIRVWTHEGHCNLGIAASYRLGLSKATAKFVAFLEADDLWEQDNLQKKISALKSSPEAGVVYSSCRPFGEGPAPTYWKLHVFLNNAWTPRNRPFDNFKTLLYRNNVSSFSHFAARRALLEGLRLPPDHGDRLDWWILAQLSLRSLFLYLPGKLCQWRIHSGSVSYKRWDAAELKQFNRFLLGLYAMLNENLNSCEISVENALKKQALESAIKDQEFIRQTGNWFHPRRFRSHPLSFIRFLIHCLLKNGLLNFSGFSSVKESESR